MIVTKTFKTMFTKPLILIMSAMMSLVPYIMGTLLGSIPAGTYGNIITGFTILFTISFIGPMATYTYQVCNDSINSDWFVRGILKNTFKILPVILVTRLIVPVVSGMGILGYVYFGTGALFIGAIAITFEAVAKISIGATESFTDALDKAVSVTKGIYLKVAAVAFAFAVLQTLLVPGYTGEMNIDKGDMQVYVEGLNGYLPADELSDDFIENLGLDIEKEITELENKMKRQNLWYGLLQTISNAFILIFCAHHFVEDKLINDAAQKRLNGDYT